MSSNIRMFFEIIGGPHDGDRMEFNGEALSDDVIKKMETLRVEDHFYKVVKFDRSKMEGVLEY